MVNFTSHDVAVLAKAGFNVELGFIGQLQPHLYLPYFLPHPPLDYDVYVYNSIPPEERTAGTPTPLKNILVEGKVVQTLSDLNRPPPVRIALVGQCDSWHVKYLGVPNVTLTDAHPNVSGFQVLPADTTFSVPELHKEIAGFVHEIVTVEQYILADLRAIPHPYYHYPVIVNRNGDVVAAYGARYNDQMARTEPLYIVLPQLRDNARAVSDLLRLVTRLLPELFPDLQKQVWYDSDEFALSEEKAIEREIEQKVVEANEFIDDKRAEKVAVAERYGFIKSILVATESAEVVAERLSINVKRTLEFLGFQVEDIDAKTKGAIKKEDFWVKDGDFLAITEISATTNKNPKTKEYSDLLGRMSTIYKRKDLVPESQGVTGLLVLNYDIDTHPWRRPRLYSGGDEEFVAAAKASGIGLLSTVELYKIAIAAKDGAISKEEARRLVKQFGRIEFKSSESPGKRQ
jgi:hypothetical protein